MDCKNVLELLPLYIEGELEKDEIKAVKEHLDSCKDCRNELKFLKSILKETSALPDAEPSEDFHTKLKERLLSENKVRVVNLRSLRKTFTAIAASAAVIAVSVTALNTEFYKIDNSALEGKKGNVSESIVIDSENVAGALENAEIKEKQEVTGRQEEKKTEIKNEAIFNKNEEEKSKPEARTITTEILKDVNEEPIKDTPQEKKALPMETAESDYTKAEALDEGAAVANLEGANAVEEDKALGGGGSVNPDNKRKSRISVGYYKTVLNVEISESDESLEELLKGFTVQNGEYKIATQEFYELADKIFAIPDIVAYYTSENMTEEYESLKDGDERKKQIEEICSYGYIKMLKKR